MSDAEFKRLYSNLNPRQKEAVDTIDGPVMVIAGPGTGKTTVLTLRIAQILRKTDTPASGILAITYTEAGVKAMRQKLRVIMGSRADEVRLHTFHGFASSIIAEFSDHFSHLQGVAQMTDIDAESFIRDILKKERFASLRPFGNAEFYVSKIVGAISDAKREAQTPERVRAFANEEIKRIKADPDSISSRGPSKGKLRADSEALIEKCERTILFADVYEAYEAKKRAEKKMDFDDLISELLMALQKDALLLRLLQEKFFYFLVDEHQDTNDSQNLLIRLLADFFESPNLFVVGDEKQAIFRFQGASVENFLRFKNAWKSMKSILLEANYRSHQHLLDGAFSLIEHNYNEGEHTHLRVRLVSEGNHIVRPIELLRGSEEAGLHRMAERISEVLKAEKESTVAVIAKTNRDLERVLRFLEAKQIPVTSERNIDIFSHPIGNLFFTLVEYLLDFTNAEALAKTILAGLWGLSLDDGLLCVKNLRSGRWGTVEKIPSLRYIQNRITEEGALAFLLFIAETSGFIKLVAREPSSVEVWRGIVELSESLIRDGHISDPRIFLQKLLAYKISSEERSVKISVGTPELRVRAMTAHGSKGLEFDYVFLPFATEQSWIGRTRGLYFTLSRRKKDDGEDSKDVRRLFYVALTRAKKHAIILVPEEEMGGKALTPLRFLDELDPAFVETVSLPTVQREALLPIPFSEGVSQRARKINDLAKTVLLEKGLSVTALNHFLSCPSEFIYQSILKLPRAPAPLPEKGIAVHEAFARIWSEKEPRAKKLLSVFKGAVSSYLERSLLPVFEKEAVKKELFEDAPIIVKELQGHFVGSALVESWSESRFEGVYEGKSVSIPIHGQLDAVQEKGDEVFVFDYKTKEKMSVAEIKGQTKSSKGDYFRQLVFYKLLLQSDPRYKNKQVIPSLIFALPDRKGKCGIASLPVEDADVVQVKSDIQSLIESVWSGRVMSDFCKESDCEWCTLKRVSISGF